MIADILTWFSNNSSLVIALAVGLFALFRYLDQRRRELTQRQFEQYWKLIETSQKSSFLAEQTIALLLLKRFPDYKAETIQFLGDAKNRNHNWSQQNAANIEAVLKHFGN